MRQKTIIAPKLRARRTEVTLAVVLAIGGSTSAPLAAETGDTLQQLKDQLQMLQQKIEELERQQKQSQATMQEKMQQIDAEQSKQAQAIEETKQPQTTPPENVVTGGDTKKSYKLPGTNTSLSWGGYAKLDAIHNSDSAVGASNFRNELYIPSTVPIDNTDGEENEVVFHAKESRLWFKSHTPTDWGPLVAYIETDIFNLQSTDSERITNGNTPRLRHAYGKLGNLLAGQTWMTFMPAYTWPEINDFGGPAGQVFGRQAQIRWTQPTAWGNWQVAMENPETTLDLPDGGGRAEPSDDRIPDIVARLNYKDTWGQASVAGIARQLRADGTFEGIDVDDEKWGGAVSLATKIKAFGKDYFTATAQYGALGRYMAYNVFPGGYVDDNGDIDTVDSWGAWAGYKHYWTPTIRSNWIIGYAKADNDTDAVGNAVNESVLSSHINLMWSPVPATRFGIEWLHARRELENGNDGNLNRIQVSAKYDF